MIYSNSAFNAPFKPMVRLGTAVQPNYLFGDFNFDTQPFLFIITSVAITGDVATYGVTIQSGGGPSERDMPSVGAKMGVQGTQTNGGVFNVDPAIVTAVTYNVATGTGTISCALTNANIATTPDVGKLVVQAFEKPDLVAAGTASRPLALWYGPDMSDSSRCAFAEARWSGTVPTTATVVMEIANVDDDARYQAVENAYGTSPAGSVVASDNLAAITAGAVTQSGANYQFLQSKFVRAKVLTLVGADDTTGLVVSVVM